MTLEEALKDVTAYKYIKRRSWKDKDMRLVTTAKTLEDLNINLMQESLDADDWELFDFTQDGK